MQCLLGRSALAILALVGPANVQAREENAAMCVARKSYAGPATHAPVLPLLSSTVPDGSLSPADVHVLDTAFVTLRNHLAASALTAAVLIPDEGIWHSTVAPSDAKLLFWASAGKMATAVVVLQMVEEGRLSLDDPVSRWVAGVPNGNVMTIQDLLAHTSGVYSANEDENARRDPHYLDLAEQLEIVRRHGPLFCPGAAWRYSNTGYSLLGEIVRQVDGRPIDEAITYRIIRPLGLHTMRALPPGGSSAGVAPLSSGPGTMIEPSWAGAAGPIVSDASDMGRFLAALLGGRLLKRDTITKMLRTPYPMFDSGTFYGLGLMLFEVPDGERALRWIGHAGGAPGASAVVAYSPEDNAIIAVAMTGNGSASSSANFLLKKWIEARPISRTLPSD